MRVQGPLGKGRLVRGSMRGWSCAPRFRRSRNDDNEEDPYVVAKMDGESKDKLDCLRQTASDKQRGNWYHKITHRDSVVAHLPKFPQGNVHYVRKLSEGRFGDIYMATAESILPGECTSQVTVKALRRESSKEDQSDFLSEAWFRNSLKHRNVVRLLGVCMHDFPKLMLLELMEEEANLVTYLREKNPSETGSIWSESEVASIALDIALGVDYLHGKRIVYRDLCASSCVVLMEKGVEMAASNSEVSSPSRRTVVKLAEFSLTCDLERREYYRRQSAGQLLTRWMSPEALLDGVFTEHSDTWAFGVVLWEMTSFGQLPYPDKSSSDLLDFIASGQRLNKPPHCSKKLHQLMASCWQLPASCRPSFSSLIESLRHLQQRSSSSTALLSSSGKKLKSLISLPLSSFGSSPSDDGRYSYGVYAMSAPASPILRSENSSFQRSKNLSQRSARSFAMFTSDSFPTPLLGNTASGSLGESWDAASNVQHGTTPPSFSNGAVLACQPAACDILPQIHKPANPPDDENAGTRRHSCPTDGDLQDSGCPLNLSAGLTKSLPQLDAKIQPPVSLRSLKQLHETSL